MHAGACGHNRGAYRIRPMYLNDNTESALKAVGGKICLSAQYCLYTQFCFHIMRIVLTVVKIVSFYSENR